MPSMCQFKCPLSGALLEQEYEGRESCQGGEETQLPVGLGLSAHLPTSVSSAAGLLPAQMAWGSGTKRTVVNLEWKKQEGKGMEGRQRGTNIPSQAFCWCPAICTPWPEALSPLHVTARSSMAGIQICYRHN